VDKQTYTSYLGKSKLDSTPTKLSSAQLIGTQQKATWRSYWRQLHLCNIKQTPDHLNNVKQTITALAIIYICWISSHVHKALVPRNN